MLASRKNGLVTLILIILSFFVFSPLNLYAQLEDRIKRQADEFLRLILNEGEYFVLVERAKPQFPSEFLPGFPIFPFLLPGAAERIGGILVTVVLDEMVSEAKEKLISEMLPKILGLDPRLGDSFTITRGPVWPTIRPRQAEITPPQPQFQFMPQAPSPQRLIPPELIEALRETRRVESKTEVAGGLDLSGDIDTDIGDIEVEVKGEIGGKVEMALPEVAIRGGLRVEAPEGATRSIAVELKGTEGLLGQLGVSGISLRRILPFIIALAGFLILYALLSLIFRRRREEREVGAAATAGETVPPPLPFFGGRETTGAEVAGGVSIQSEISKLAVEKPDILASVLRRKLKTGEDGVRSAAVLFRSLSLEGSLKISSLLQKDEFERILSEIRKVDGLTPAEMERTLTSMYIEALSELSMDPLLRRNPFTFLTYYSDDEILQTISAESDEVVACLIVNAKPEKASAILENLEPERRSRIVTLMPSVSRMPDREVEQIAERVKSKLERVERSAILSNQSFDLLLKTIENMDNLEIQEEILRSIKERDYKLYENLRKKIVLFQDIYKIPEEILGEILIGVDTADIARAFHDMPTGFQHTLQRVLPKVKFQMVIEEIEKRKFSPLEVSRARKKLISKIKALVEEGRIKPFVEEL
jgi:flagellar motor switch protein FliG